MCKPLVDFRATGDGGHASKNSFCISSSTTSAKEHVKMFWIVGNITTHLLFETKYFEIPDSLKIPDF